MATLQKFKLLATQCAVAKSPTHSPSTSPVIHLCRRKTLRMLLSRPSSRRSNDVVDSCKSRKKDSGVRQKLKDLLVSSSPPPQPQENRRESGGGGLIFRRGGLRCLNGTLRHRLLRRAWRPVLVTIPE